MELNPTEFDNILNQFLAVWSIDKVQKMTIEEYADLSNHNSFCYWLEYGSKFLGQIGGIALHKFELWKPKDPPVFKDDTYLTDGEYAWNRRIGTDRQEVFEEVRRRILDIISKSEAHNFEGIDLIQFNSIGKWKIAFLYSNKQLVPIYSKRALLAIANGLGGEFSRITRISELQNFILPFKEATEEMGNFAFRVYTQFAEKKKKRNYYIIGSKYSDENGNDSVPKIDEFLKRECVAIGFLDWLDFSEYMGADKKEVDEFVEENWTATKPGSSKIRRYFRLLSQVKEGDIIAVKSQGAYNNLEIIAYAEVVKRNGSVYENDYDDLGHCIHVDFLDANFHKRLGLTYAETIHQLTATKDRERFDKIFGWYIDTSSDEEVELEDVENQGNENDEDEAGGYNEKSEDGFERSPTASVKVKLIHNRIQNRFIAYLRNTYKDEIISGERKRIDAKRENSTEIFIYEIKPFENVYMCIREGIGQLLDYAFKDGSKKEKRIIIVGPNLPLQRDMDFINALKAIITIQLSYIAFDEAALTATSF